MITSPCVKPSEDIGYIHFIKAAAAKLKDIPLGTEITFECPYCNKEAAAVRSPNNGHIRIRCEQCEIVLIE